MIRPPKTFGSDLLKQIDADLRANSPSLRAGILDQLRKEVRNPNVASADFQVSVEEPQERVFHINTTIPQVFGHFPEKKRIYCSNELSPALQTLTNG